MCLSTIKTEEEMKEWLKTQPDIITAYKLVKKTPKLRTFLDRLFKCNKTRYFLSPMHYGRSLKKYKKKNRIKGNRPQLYPTMRMDRSTMTYSDSNFEYFTTYFENPYKAYFHLWFEKFDHIGGLDIDFVIIKCHVPKHLITAVGTEEVVVERILVKGTDDPKKMGTIKTKYKHIPTIVSKGFDIVNYK